MGSTDKVSKNKGNLKKSDKETDMSLIKDKPNNDKNINKENDIKQNDSSNDFKKNANARRVTPNVDIVGAIARARSNSENSENTSPQPESMKRQRTVNGSSPIENFIFPGVAASPPKFMSLEEVMKAAEGVSNMVLAHEIAVDKNFKLEKFDPPENSLERQVRDVMHKAFWDNLQEQLAEDPACYNQAFVLLQEVREKLIEITLPQHTKLRQEITEKFDIELIKQQAEHRVLKFEEYSQYVLSVMARLCAPVRDDVIQGLMRNKEIVLVFRGVLETLDLMRLDMANYRIQQIRPYIIAQSVEYEKEKFDEFLKTQNDGLEITKEWLKSHISSDLKIEVNEASTRNVVNKIIAKSYLSLLSWPDDKTLPETVVLDGSRILELRDRLTQVCLMGTVLLVTLASFGSSLPKADEIKTVLKKNICSILDSAASETETYNLVPNIAEQVIKDVSDHMEKNDQPAITNAAASALKSQLHEIKNPNQRIRQLITNRAQEFIGSLLSSTTAKPVQVPPGLSTFQEELAHICGTILRIVSHNRAVFGDYYADIIVQYLKTDRETSKTKVEDSMVKPV